jgi:hypothetical protein
VIAALPPLFSAKLVQQRDAAKSIGVRLSSLGWALRPEFKK